MPDLCYQKANSDPPVCGVHGVPLVPDRVFIDQITPGRAVECMRCPTSGFVVKDLKKQG
jgi:hypothetical protein